MRVRSKRAALAHNRLCFAAGARRIDNTNTKTARICRFAFARVDGADAETPRVGADVHDTQRPAIRVRSKRTASAHSRLCFAAGARRIDNTNTQTNRICRFAFARASGADAQTPRVGADVHDTQRPAIRVRSKRTASAHNRLCFAAGARRIDNSNTQTARIRRFASARAAGAGAETTCVGADVHGTQRPAIRVRCRQLINR
jgi:hypothetical protein